MSRLEKGTIVNFTGSWKSGLGTLWIQKEGEADMVGVPCENESTIEILSQYVGGVRNDAGVDLQQFRGWEVFFTMDDTDRIMDGIVPVDDSPKLQKMYSSCK